MDMEDARMKWKILQMKWKTAIIQTSIRIEVKVFEVIKSCPKPCPPFPSSAKTDLIRLTVPLANVRFELSRHQKRITWQKFFA